MHFLTRFWHRLAVSCLLLACAAAQAADLAEIRERGVLRHIGIQYANFVTKEGEGLDVELVRGFARHIGVRYELVLSDFYHVIRDLLGQDVVRQGDTVTLTGQFPVKGDMIAAGFTVLPWRQAVLSYSAPVFPSQVLLVTRIESPHQPISPQPSLREEIAQTRKLLGTKSLLVMEKTCLDPANYGLTGVGIDLRSQKASNNLDDMVPTLLRGGAEFTLLDVPDAILDLQRWTGRIKLLGPISEHQNLAAAFPKSSPALRAAYDEYLKKVRADGTYDQLVNKYYPGIRRYFPEFFARKL
jgi:ABC-type amino acid transport substrate-binding protein